MYALKVYFLTRDEANTTVTKKCCANICIINIEKEAHNTVANMLTLSLMFLVAEHVCSPGPASDPGSDQSSG